MAKTIPRQPGVPASVKVALTLLRKAEEVGADGAMIARAAGVPSIRQPDWRGALTPEQFTLIYRDCVAALERFDTRRQGWPPMTKGEVDMLCFCIINCPTLASAIERAAAFCAMLGGRAGQLSLVRTGGQTAFCMRTFRRKRDVAGFVSDITGLSTYHRLFSWLIGEDIEPLFAEVCYPPQLEMDVVARLMPCPVRYSRPENLLRFPAHYLDRPLIRSYAELVDLLKTFPFNLDATMSKHLLASERVRHLIGGALAQGAPIPTLRALARQLGVSDATLKRKLTGEGTSMRSLRARCRHELALELLSDHALTLADVAQRLGFSDANTFYRAFRSWTGRTPAAYRRVPSGASRAI